MLFLPFRADLSAARIPFAAIAMMIVCVLVFYSQSRNDVEFRDDLTRYCEKHRSADLKRALQAVGHGSGVHSCVWELGTLLSYRYPVLILERELKTIDPMSGKTREETRTWISSVLMEHRDLAARASVGNLTDELAYYPDTFDIGDMFSATFAHGDLMHIAFNLVFFMAFAVSVEAIVGTLKFLLLVTFLVFSTSLGYKAAALYDVMPLGTVGLSGVVMGMIGALARLAPGIRIRCLFWLLLMVRIVRVPALLLAIFYIGSDVFSVLGSGRSNTNFAAHLWGGITAYLFCFVFFRDERLRATIEVDKLNRDRRFTR